MKAQDFAEELRAAAEWWEQHPDVPAPEDVTMNVWVATRAAFAALARTVGHAEKNTSGSIYWLRVATGDGVIVCDFNITRSEVCDRRVLGVKLVPEVTVPEHEEEVVEWDCRSIFAEDADPSPVGQAPPAAVDGAPQGASGPTS